MATSSWLLAARLAPVCVRCHHAGCVITGRIRAPADAILVIASDSLWHSPAAPRRHGHPGRRLMHQRPGTKKRSHHDPPAHQPDRTPARAHEEGRRRASGSAGALPGISHPQGPPGALVAAAVALLGCPRGSRNMRGARRSREIGYDSSGPESVSRGSSSPPLPGRDLPCGLSALRPFWEWGAASAWTRRPGSGDSGQF
jgi:hypothetical protein